jgi:hypothetical protein
VDRTNHTFLLSISGSNSTIVSSNNDNNFTITIANVDELVTLDEPLVIKWSYKNRNYADTLTQLLNIVTSLNTLSMNFSVNQTIISFEESATFFITQPTVVNNTTDESCNTGTITILYNTNSNPDVTNTLISIPATINSVYTYSFNPASSFPDLSNFAPDTYNFYMRYQVAPKTVLSNQVQDFNTYESSVISIQLTSVSLMEMITLFDKNGVPFSSYDNNNNLSVNYDDIIFQQVNITTFNGNNNVAGSVSFTISDGSTTKTICDPVSVSLENGNANASIPFTIHQLFGVDTNKLYTFTSNFTPRYPNIYLQVSQQLQISTYTTPLSFNQLAFDQMNDNNSIYYYNDLIYMNVSVVPFIS